MRTPSTVRRCRVVLVVFCLGATVALANACKCDDAEPTSAARVTLTEEDQRAANVDRVRFNLKTPDDYAKEAYLAIDVDNAKAELETLRREIDLEFAAGGGATQGATPGASH